MTDYDLRALIQGALSPDGPPNRTWAETAQIFANELLAARPELRVWEAGMMVRATSYGGVWHIYIIAKDEAWLKNDGASIISRLDDLTPVST